MKEEDNEEQLLREVGLQSAISIFLARQRAEEELIRAKEALRRQVELLRVTMASIGDAVVTTDTEGRVLSLNAVAESLTGWTEQEAQGRPLIEIFRIINEDDRQPVGNPVEQALREGRIVGLANHTILVARDGTQTPIDDSAAPIRDDQGHIYGVVLIFRSIAERKQAEKNLSQSERELADFFENASVGLHWIGPDGTILRVNQAELKMLGYTREEYVGHHIAEFHVDQDVIADILQSLGTGEILREYEVRMRCKDGSIRHVLIDSSVMWEDDRFIHTRCFTRDITDRKRAEEAQARLAAVVESSQDAIISKTLEGRIVSWNAGAEQIFGYRPEEVIGQPITLLIPPERQDEERLILERLSRGERIESYETVRVTKQGRRIDVSLTISPIRDSDGRIIGASKISRDITARKRTEQRLATQYSVTHALAESDRLDEAAPKILQAICEHLEWCIGALWRVDKQGNVLRCVEVYHLPDTQVPRFEAASRERAFECGVGLPGRVWAGGEAVWIGNVVDDGNFPRAAIAVAEGLHGAFGFPIKLNEEILGVMEFFSQEVRQPEPDLMEMVTAVGSQVGQFIGRKRADEERQALTNQLAAELAAMTRLQQVSMRMGQAGDFSLLLEEILDAAIEITGAEMGNIQLLEEGALRIATQRGFETPFLDFFNVVHDGQAACGSAMRNGERVIVEDVASSPIFVGTPALDVMLAANVRAVQSTPLVSRSGRMLGIFSTHYHAPRRPSERELRLLDLLARQAADLIERKQADEALRVSLMREQDARIEAEQANRLKDEFIATLSHELRSPLNSIFGYAEVLLRRPDAKHVPLVREAAEKIHRNAAAQAQLINDLLDLSRLQTGKLAIERRPVNLVPIIGDAVESVRTQAKMNGLNLSEDYPPNSLMVNVDPVRGQQVVWNLVNNAVKFTPRGGHVSVRLRQEADEVKLEVEDTGQGIAPDFLPHVFEMFRQADARTTRKHGGMGIGLALVKQLVDLHGGRIEAHSEGAGRGARFTVWFPLHSATDEQPVAVTKSNKGELLGARILVVDDSPDSVQMLRLLLEGEGAIAETALSGDDALKKAETWPMDLIISDISMPEMDGYELLKELRRQSRYAEIPAIALTGFGRQEDVERARQAGFTTHLTKPLDFDHLVRLARITLQK